MRDCGCSKVVLAAPMRGNVKNDASEEFARQARELVASLDGKPDHERRDAIAAELERFEQPRYALVAGEALDVLHAALATPVVD